MIKSQAVFEKNRLTFMVFQKPPVLLIGPVSEADIAETEDASLASETDTAELTTGGK